MVLSSIYNIFDWHEFQSQNHNINFSHFYDFISLILESC